MIFDIIGAILQTPVPLRHISHKQVLDQTLGVLIEVSWEFNLAL